jgi:hypothetical protein
VSGQQIAIFALTIAGYCTGWFARGGSVARHKAPAGPDALPEDAHEVLSATADACREALASPDAAAVVKLREATRRAASVDVALELRLGADDPRYRRFERILNVLESVAHQATPGIYEPERSGELSSVVAGIAAELDAAQA